MHILGAGRGAFLEFLRNLTPTVLLISVALLIWFRLDFRQIDMSNWGGTTAFFACSITAALSLFANVSQFVDNAFSPIPGLERALRLLRFRGHSTSVLLGALLNLTWRRKPMIVGEAVLVVLISTAAVQGGTIAAVSAATTALRNGLR